MNRSTSASLTSGETQTDTGDRAELEDLPEDLPFWKDIAASSENCIGTECPRYNDCFITRMRQRAAESDLVVVNHHLLCADAAVRQSALRRSDPDLPLRRGRRSASARRRRDAVLRHRRQQLSARRSRRATSIARWRRNSIADHGRRGRSAAIARSAFAITRARSSQSCR